MRIIIVIALASYLFVSCKKNDDANNDADFKQKLVDRKWMVTSDLEQDKSGNIVDAFKTWNYWEIDDYYIWYSSGKYVVNDGANFHPGSFQQILDSGSWSFKNAIITVSSLNSGGTHYPAEVKDVSRDTLKLEIEYTTRNVKAFVTLANIH